MKKLLLDKTIVNESIDELVTQATGVSSLCDRSPNYDVEIEIVRGKPNTLHVKIYEYEFKRSSSKNTC